MTKSQQREINILQQMHQLGGYQANIALGLSALIRCAMNNKQRTELCDYATKFGVTNHPNYKI